MRRPPISVELLDQPPPSAPALELALLGSLICALVRMLDVRAILQASDFHVEAFGRLFGVLLKAYDQGRRWVDVPRMVNHLREIGLFQEIGFRRLEEMACSACTEAETIATAERIRDLARRREAIHTGCEMIRAAYVGDSSANMEGALL